MDALVWLGTVTAGAIVGIVIRESFAWGRDKWVERKNSIRGTIFSQILFTAVGSMTVQFR